MTVKVLTAGPGDASMTWRVSHYWTGWRYRGEPLIPVVRGDIQ